MRRILTFCDPLLECKVARLVFLLLKLVSESNIRGKLGDEAG